MDNITSEPLQPVTEILTALKSWIFPSWYSGVIVCILVVLAAGIPGNLFTILAYFKCQQLRNPTNLLICNQSVGDLFTCLSGYLFAVLVYTEVGQALAASHKYLCLVSLGLTVATLQSSIANILALSTDRFIAVYFSFEYYNWVTDRNVKIAVVTIWTVVISIFCLPLFGWNTWKPEAPCVSVNMYSKTFFQGLFIIPNLLGLLVCAVENFAIAFTSIRKQRSIAPMAVVVSEEQQTEEGNAKSKNQFKVTKMLLLVVGCFYAAWLPFILLNTLIFSMPTAWEKNGVPKWILIAFEYSKAFLGFNPIINPFIYGWRNVLFRKTYYKLLGIKIYQNEP
ncbi:hypothetical protein CAPTEDRAFT_133785 [Capitella teleta]|uniref:G-protein coupled receptors family 1 profile domain-containing protein n=1 Tax=Capitella teleta TaxID=283909 RepID=R7U6S6_CAPTE|nr:hypothetical protein CAPTEDRAFT_133785 [Capitella teleta]|eukprot:ELU01694.1 hypothetical protein CAPTEDRAFT_133785 [Capitella teleta]